MSGVIQICLSVSGLCVVMWGFVGGGLIVVCTCGSVCNQIKVVVLTLRSLEDGHMVARNMLSKL